MARHALKTPVLVGIAAIAVTTGAYSFRQRNAVPPCTAPQDEFCLQLKLYENPYYEDANRHFDVVAIEGGWTEFDTAFAGLDVSGGDRSGVLYARRRAEVDDITQADFDAVPADYRVKQAKSEARLHLAIGNYFVCSFNPKLSGLPETAARCIYIVYGKDLRMDGNTYVETLRVDPFLYGMEPE